MPKKPPRNAFYFYMQDFKEEQRKKGINYQNMAEVANAAGPVWKDLPPPARVKYEQLAKKEKQKTNFPEMKFTSQGVSYAEIQRREKELKEAEEMEVKEINNVVKLAAFNDSVKHLDFFVMDVNYYCQTTTGYVICESTILRFNLTEGIRDEYHEMINPGEIPMGYASDAKASGAEIGIELPDETKKRSNYMLILANIIDYLKTAENSTRKTLPPIFTMPDKVAPVTDFIQQMCHRASHDESIFRVYKINGLFFTLINAIKSAKDEGFPKESLALVQLKKDVFKYNPGLACEHHDEVDKAIECTMSRAKRWAFTILDHCCPLVGIEMEPGKHVPNDFDMEKIYSYKQQTNQTNRTASAFMRQMDSSIEMNSTTETSMEFVVPKRVHKPLRKPKTNFSLNIRAAPELSETPSTSQVGVGRGRGSLSSSLNNMKIGQ